MPIVTSNQLGIAYKKLVGKAHTNVRDSAAAEAFPSSVQVGGNEVFAQIPTISLFSQQTTFELEPIATSIYGPNIAQGEGERADNSNHAYRLKFPPDYAGYFQDIITADKPYLDQHASIQLIPTKYSNDFAAHVYEDEQKTNELYESGDQDWSLDYYSGILFVQDRDVSLDPLVLEAYVYTGKYITDILQESGNNPTRTKGKFDLLEVGDPTEPELFDQITNEVVRIKGNSGLEGDLQVTGKLYTKELIVEETTQVITTTNHSGENVFGDATSEAEGAKDTHTFYGDVNINGNLNVTGDGAGGGKLKVKEITKADDQETLNSNNVVFEIKPVGEEDYTKYDLFIINTDDLADNGTDDGNGGLTHGEDPTIILLPDASDLELQGKQYIFKHVCSENHTVTIGASPNQTIDGASEYYLFGQHQSLTVVAHSGKWYIV